jgi:hypothetical protein
MTFVPAIARANEFPRITLTGRLGKVPGKRTALKLVAASWPPHIAWMRTALRLIIAGLLLIAGYSFIAHVVFVLSLINLIAAIELQISRVALETWKSGLDLVKARFKATQALVASFLSGLVSSATAADDDYWSAPEVAFDDDPDWELYEASPASAPKEASIGHNDKNVSVESHKQPAAQLVLGG